MWYGPNSLDYSILHISLWKNWCVVDIIYLESLARALNDTKQKSSDIGYQYSQGLQIKHISYSVQFAAMELWVSYVIAIQL